MTREDTFGEISEQLRPDFIRWARIRFGFQHADAEDAYQDTLLYIWEHRAVYPIATREQMLPIFMQTYKHRLLDHVRKAARVEQTKDVIYALYEEGSLQANRVRKVRAALMDLDSDSRRLAQEEWMYEYPQSEIASRHGVSRMTIYKRLRRIKKLLRLSLRDAVRK